MEVREMSRDVQMADIPLDRQGLLPLHPASFYDGFVRESVMLWCYRNARYGLPTAELVNWLKEKIGGRKAIEIGSGSGDLAHHLGIPATDNRMQEWDHIRVYYATIGQAVVRYPDFVERLDAASAVECHHPDVVVASWVTRWLHPDAPPPPGGGSIYGIKEDEIVAQCDYILIGNLKVHAQKPIMALEHEEYELPFLRSRAMHPSLDRVWIWKKGAA